MMLRRLPLLHSPFVVCLSSLAAHRSPLVVRISLLFVLMARVVISMCTHAKRAWREARKVRHAAQGAPRSKARRGAPVRCATAQHRAPRNANHRMIASWHDSYLIIHQVINYLTRTSQTVENVARSFRDPPQLRCREPHAPVM